MPGRTRGAFIDRERLARIKRGGSSERPRGSVQNATYQSLNGLRGIAALVVVCFHFSLRQPFGVGSGFIAVDLFFALSGFVIAASYDRRLASGMGVRAFLRLRVVRLYPLYALGTTIGVAAVLCSPTAHVGDAGVASVNLARALPYAVLMLPAPPAAGWANVALYPFDDPAWSLFFELFINLVYAATYRIWTVPRLVVVLATGLVAFASIYAATGTLYGNGGWDWSSLPFGFVRVTYAFAFGVLIERLRPRLTWLPSVSTPVVLALFPCMLAVPGTAGLFCSILVGMPLLVALAVVARPSPALATALSRAGAASYPLYAVHKPIHAFAASIAEALHIDVPVVPFDMAAVVVLVPVAVWLEQAYDRPVRACMRRWLPGDPGRRRPVLSPAYRGEAQAATQPPPARNIAGT